MSDLFNTSFEVAGKSYSISFTDWDARELAAKGFDIYSPESEEMLQALFSPSKVFSEALIYCCKPESEEDFLRGLDPETLEKAREAMKKAIANFFPVQNRESVLNQFSEISKAISNPELMSQLLQQVELTS